MIKVEVQVSKESYEFGIGIAKTVGAIYSALKDGWQPGQDLPVVMQALLADLVPSIQGIEKIADENKESSQAFMTAWALAGLEVGKAVGLLKP